MSDTGRRDVSIGTGLWNMRSTGRHPRRVATLYRELLDDARFVESLGFDSLWLGEHRLWYDGWCPQPVLAAGAVLAATDRLAVGTGIHLLPQHDHVRAAHAATSVARLFPGRLLLGVGLGYRREEFAGLGRDIGDRAQLLRAGLDALRTAGYPGRVRLGGRSAATARRAAGMGAGVLLPPGMTHEQIETFISDARAAASDADASVPPVGVMCDVWIADDAEAARSTFEPILRRHYGEYVRAWWARLPDGAADERKIAAQLDRAVATAAIGTAAEVATTLGSLLDAGVDMLVLQSVMEDSADAARGQLERQAAELLPRLREQGA